MSWLNSADVEKLRACLASKKYATGTSTHGFYHYPARFSPEIARAVIETFSAAGDWVLDPFMGGGTTIIEGLALGRRMIGVDINALAHFVADVRTTPLSENDQNELRAWAKLSAFALVADATWVIPANVSNLPASVDRFVSGALAFADELPFPRQRAFARCALLRLGQWALDCRDFAAPRIGKLAGKPPRLVSGMVEGPGGVPHSCRIACVPGHKVTPRRPRPHRSSDR